jgi:hypothetical protein
MSVMPARLFLTLEFPMGKGISLTVRGAVHLPTDIWQKCCQCCSYCRVPVLFVSSVFLFIERQCKYELRIKNDINYYVCVCRRRCMHGCACARAFVRSIVCVCMCVCACVCVRAFLCVGVCLRAWFFFTHNHLVHLVVYCPRIPLIGHSVRQLPLTVRQSMKS